MPTKIDPVSIESVKSFWDSQPLFTGESYHGAGTKEFFEDHTKTYLEDVFPGLIDERFFPRSKELSVLDLGCGIGFWTEQFCKRDYKSVTGADLSLRSLELARERIGMAGLKANFRNENAELLSFADASFDHVNCLGVVHHTPHPERAVAEIARVLKPGASATISVYYRNILLRNFSKLKGVFLLLSKFGVGLKGRGRETMLAENAESEIVRLYDGSDNPLGIAYSRSEFEVILKQHYKVEEVFYHFFPKRALWHDMPRSLHRLLDQKLPFMICFRLKKL